MVNINWKEFKEFKSYRLDNKDNFDYLIDFMKSYYNMIHPEDIFESLDADLTAQMMLEKRGISDPESLETYMQKM